MRPLSCFCQALSLSKLNLLINPTQKFVLRVLANIEFRAKVLHNFLWDLTIENSEQLDVLATVELDLENAERLFFRRHHIVNRWSGLVFDWWWEAALLSWVRSSWLEATTSVSWRALIPRLRDIALHRWLRHSPLTESIRLKLRFSDWRQLGLWRDVLLMLRLPHWLLWLIINWLLLNRNILLRLGINWLLHNLLHWLLDLWL